MSRYLFRHYPSVQTVGLVSIDAPNVKFGSNVILYPGVQIWGTGEITIGDNVAIGKDTIIFSSIKIVIGNDGAIAGQAYIIDCDHGIARNILVREQPLVSDPVFIGNDVWIGAGAKILKWSHIGDGAIVGALSLVKGSSLEPYSINVGIPSKQIGFRK